MSSNWDLTWKTYEEAVASLDDPTDEEREAAWTAAAEKVGLTVAEFAQNVDPHRGPSRVVVGWIKKQEPPKSGNVSELDTRQLTGAVFPWDDSRQEPVFLGIPGAPLDFLPIFSKASDLRSLMDEADVAYSKIKQIDDAREFLSSLPGWGRDFEIAFNPRILPNGRVRFHRIVVN